MEKKSRLLANFYDSVRQRVPSTERDKDRELFRGRLRLDTLLHKKLVLTDAMILDGRYFLDETPNELLEFVKRSDEDNDPPIEIRTRSEGLEEALIGLVKKTGADKLKSFQFSAIEDDEQREHVTEELEKVLGKKVKDWRDILKLFREMEVDKENVERLEKSWAVWFEAQDESKLCTKPWNSNFLFNDTISQLLTERQQESENLTSQIAEKFLRFIGNNKNNRSLIESKFKQLYGIAESESGKNELIRIWNWYDRCYLATIATHHNCSTLESVDYNYTLSQIRMPSTTLDREADIFIDQPDIIYELGKLDNREYRDIFKNANSDLNHWWKKGEKDCLRNGMEPFVKNIAIKSSDWEGDLLRLLIGMAPGVVALCIQDINPIISILGYPLEIIFKNFLKYKTNKAEKLQSSYVTERIIKIARGRTDV